MFILFTCWLRTSFISSESPLASSSESSNWSSFSDKSSSAISICREGIVCEFSLKGQFAAFRTHEYFGITFQTLTYLIFYCFFGKVEEELLYYLPRLIVFTNSS